jgi:ribonucleotide monophosphatase NagD (HAD superfamily)
MITGKPFLITYKYAVRIIEKYLRNKFGVDESNSFKTIYVIGYVTVLWLFQHQADINKTKHVSTFRDNPDTDIFGGNLYKANVKQQHTENINKINIDVKSILVATGVHSKDNLQSLVEAPDHVHKDIVFEPNMRTPDYNVENITDAVRLIIENEIS